MRERLEDLLQKLDYTVERGKVEDCRVSSLVYDSRKLKKDCLFVCMSGMNFDGHDFAEEAVLKGAKALVIEHEIRIPETEQVTVIRVKDTRSALALISAAYFDYPAEKLTTIGVTGTKGKTTSTYLIRQILMHAGHQVGLIGTIETIIGREHIPSKNTTPESYLIQQYFHEMVQAGIDTVVMEVSSQAVMMRRTDGIVFDYGVFTNISPDHIGKGEHKDFEDYLSCKSRLFRQCRIGIFNGDDPHTPDIMKDNECEKIVKYGLSDGNDLRASNVRLASRKGMLGVDFHVSGLADFDAEFAMPGAFSVHNALCAIAVCLSFKAELPDILESLKEVQVKGRIEMIPISDQFTLMIDYAHNAMALESLLKALREYEPKRLICLFGCGGNRDRNRRFEMGQVSGTCADFTIITSDNPRFEEPMAIMEDIKTGIEKTDGKYIMITDRKEAIAYAISHAKEGDVIVLAGKGHEDYQEIRGNKYPMDERDLIREILAENSRKL